MSDDYSTIIENLSNRITEELNSVLDKLADEGANIDKVIHDIGSQAVSKVLENMKNTKA